MNLPLPLTPRRALNRIVFSHIVFKFGWEQTGLAPINPLYEA